MKIYKESDCRLSSINIRWTPSGVIADCIGMWGRVELWSISCCHESGVANHQTCVGNVSYVQVYLMYKFISYK